MLRILTKMPKRVVAQAEDSPGSRPEAGLESGLASGFRSRYGFCSVGLRSGWYKHSLILGGIMGLYASAVWTSSALAQERLDESLIRPPDITVPDTAAPDTEARDEEAQDIAAQLAAPAPDVAAALAKIPAGGINAAIKDLTRLGYEGDADAFYHLAEIYRLGIGREASPDVALMYYRLSAALDHPHAEMNLANILYFDDASGGQTDIEGGDTDGPSAGSDETRRSDPKGQALAIWKRRAVGGDPEAMYLYGLALWNGEAIGTSDPIRGYGLVARAADAGYHAAVNSELEMRAQLSLDARERGRDFALDLTPGSFGDDPLDLDLLFAGVESDSGRNSAPEDWTKIWRVEVGFALTDMDSVRLQANIMKKIMSSSRYAVTRIPARGKDMHWRLLYGPMSDAVEAATFCARLKRIGEDCFARAPDDP